MLRGRRRAPLASEGVRKASEGARHAAEGCGRLLQRRAEGAYPQGRGGGLPPRSTSAQTSRAAGCEGSRGRRRPAVGSPASAVEVALEEESRRRRRPVTFAAGAGIVAGRPGFRVAGLVSKIAIFLGMRPGRSGVGDTIQDISFRYMLCSPLNVPWVRQR